MSARLNPRTIWGKEQEITYFPSVADRIPLINQSAIMCFTQRVFVFRCPDTQPLPMAGIHDI